MSNKIVFWDWNGTLFPDLSQSVEAMDSVQDRYGVPRTTTEDYRAAFTLPFDKIFRRLGISESVASFVDLHTLWHAEYQKAEGDVILREGTAALLEELTSCSVQNVIVSNHIEDRILTHAKRLRILDFIAATTAFESVEAQRAGVNHKRNGVKAVMDAQSVALTDAVIIGDTIEEIEIAHALGIRSISITDGHHSEEMLRGVARGSDAFVHSIGEMRSALASFHFLQTMVCNLNLL